MTTYTSSNRGSGIHSSRSAIRVLPSIRRASRPNGIFSVDSNSSSDFSLYSSSSDMSSSSENEWSDDDFEDPLWVKDDNLRRPRGRTHRHVNAPPPTPSSISSRPSFAEHLRVTCSDDNMVLEEEDDNISSDVSGPSVKAPMAIEQPSTPRKRGRDKKERKCGSSISKTGSKAKKRDQQTAAYREFAMRLDTSALENHPAPSAGVGLTPRRCKAFSVALTPRGGFFSSSPPSTSSTSSTSSSPSESISSSATKVTPQRRERERRQIEREILTQKQQQQRQQQLAIPPLSLTPEPALGSSPKKDETGNFWRKKMRGVKAYFSSSSASVAPASPATTRPTSHSAPVSPALRDIA